VTNDRPASVVNSLIWIPNMHGLLADNGLVQTWGFSDEDSFDGKFVCS